jgi:hypothetical protein
MHDSRTYPPEGFERTIGRHGRRMGLFGGATPSELLSVRCASDVEL